MILSVRWVQHADPYLLIQIRTQGRGGKDGKGEEKEEAGIKVIKQVGLSIHQEGKPSGGFLPLKSGAWNGTLLK